MDTSPLQGTMRRHSHNIHTVWKACFCKKIYSGDPYRCCKTLCETLWNCTNNISSGSNWGPYLYKCILSFLCISQLVKMLRDCSDTVSATEAQKAQVFALCLSLTVLRFEITTFWWINLNHNHWAMPTNLPLPKMSNMHLFLCLLPVPMGASLKGWTYSLFQLQNLFQADI